MYRKNYSIDKDNQDCLFIYEQLINAFKECQLYATNPYLNIISIFFHDLMRILTGYVLKRNEMKSSLLIKSKKLVQFPYIDYNDVISGIKLTEKEIYQPYFGLSYKQKLINKYFNFLNYIFKKKKSVLITDPAIDIKYLLIHLIKKGIKVKFPSKVGIKIPNIKEQLSILYTSIKIIYELFKLPGQAKIIYLLIEKHIRSFCIKENRNLNVDLVVTGTMLNILNRIIAAKARVEGIKVISVTHGECVGVLDEPVIGYGEHTFPNIIIGYGDIEKTMFSKDEQYTKSLYDNPKYISANSNFIKTIYAGRSVERLRNLDNKKIMYVPTKCVWYERYGPFRDVPEQLYNSWQKTIIRNFPNIILKLHPKKEYSDSEYNSFVSDFNTVKIISDRQFQECLNDADVFIFDYMSTAFAIAAATSKPIIYFNIGLRNFTPLGLEKIKKRCLWIDIDILNPGDLRDKVMSIKDKECINEFTDVFSLREDNNLRREDVLLNIIVENIRS